MLGCFSSDRDASLRLVQAACRRSRFALPLTLTGFLLSLLFFPQAAAVADVPSVCKQFFLQVPPPTKPLCNLHERDSCSDQTRSLATLYNSESSLPSKENAVNHDGAFTERQNFVHMAEAGINIALIRYAPSRDSLRGNPGSGDRDKLQQLNMSIQGYANAYCGSPRTPPAIGLYLDLSFLSGANLSQHDAQEALYHGVASFFCRVPEESRAIMDKKLLVFLGTFNAARSVPPDILADLNRRFKEDFDEELYIVKSREKFAAIDPRAARQADFLDGNVRSFEDVQKEVLASEEVYRQAGSRPDSYLKKVWEKIYFEENSFPMFGVQIGDLSTEAGRRQFLDRLFRSRHGPRVTSLWLAIWSKLYRASAGSWPELTESIVRGFGADGLWRKMLLRGVHRNVIRREMLASNEFFKRAGNSPEVFLHNLFETTLGSCLSEEQFPNWKEYTERVLQHTKKRGGMDREMRREIATEALRLSTMADVNMVHSHFADRSPHIPGFADKIFSESGSSCAEFRDVASIGLSEYSITGASHYKRAWEKIVAMKPPPPLVVLISWNNFSNMSEERQKELFGDDFIDLTRNYSRLYASSEQAGNLICP